MALDLPTRARRARRLGTLLLVLAVYVAGTFLVARRYAALPEDAKARVEVRGGWFYKDGEKFLVKAVGYDPSRPGELPWQREDPKETLAADLTAIRAAGFNTIRTWEALAPDELAMAASQGVGVIQGIWVDPEGAFDDPAFRQAAAERAATVAREARGNPAVIAYLLMNEPRPEAVLAAGVEPTRLLLRDLAAAVRAHDPGVPVGFASWPGLEFLDEPSLDFVGANLYPFRPSRLLDAVGYAGMVRLWKQEVAGDRPLLVTEFGLSVAPGTHAPDAPGGATETEQAETLPRLAEDVARAGAAGAATFMWIDGWWKNNEGTGDEATHDPDDGEEWFGLTAMDTLGDRVGRTRPALAAMTAWNRVILTLPVDGSAPGRDVEVELLVEGTADDLRVEASIDGGRAQFVPTVREGGWLRGRLGLLAEGTEPQRLDFVVRGGTGVVGRYTRIVVPPGSGPSLQLEADGNVLVARVRDGTGAPASGATVRLGVWEATRRFDRRVDVVTDDRGEATLTLELPERGPVMVAGAVGSSAGTPLALDWLQLEWGKTTLTADPASPP